MEKQSKKKIWSLSNLINAIFIVLIGAIFLSPSFKGKLMQALLKTDIFRAKIEQPKSGSNIFEDSLTAQLRLTDHLGQTISLKDVEGKVILINFWATWCPPCKAEMPSLNTLYNQYKGKDNFVLFMIDVDHQMEHSFTYIQKQGFDLPVHQVESQLPAAFESKSIPFTVLINKKGEIVMKHEGMANYESKKFLKDLDKLLKE